jgi:hypothetical protein
MRKSLFLAALLVGLLLAQSASAANSQGLTWGFTKGQTFTFSMNGSTEMQILTFTTSTTTSATINMEITSVPDIPEEVDSILDIPFIGIKISYANGSSPEELTPVPINGSLAVPIGNWSLMEDIFDIYSIMPNATLINDASFFGYEMAYSLVGISVDYVLKLSKADGFLYSLTMDMESTAYGNMTIHVDLQRLGGLDTMTLVVVGVGAGVVVIIVAAVVVKMRA